MKKKGPEEKYYKHDLEARLYHWFNVICMLVLILSGLQMNSPSFNIFGKMEIARTVHFIVMFPFFGGLLIHLVMLFLMKKQHFIIPNLQDMKNIPGTMAYYLFLRKEMPSYEKYNAMQKTSYFGILNLCLVQSISGCLLYWSEQSMPFFNWAVTIPILGAFKGFELVRLSHYIFTWCFLAFLGIHLTLVFAHDVRELWAMMTGYGYREKKI